MRRRVSKRAVRNLSSNVAESDFDPGAEATLSPETGVFVELNELRSVRNKRAQVARKLSSLMQKNNSSAFSLCLWENLEWVPAWCLLPPPELQRLQLCAGGLCFSEYFKCCIDGQVLRATTVLLGQATFDKIVSCDLSAFLMPQIVDDEKVESQIMQQGASVLLSAIDHQSLRELLSGEFDCVVSMMDSALAQSILQLAQTVVQASSLQNTTTEAEAMT